MPLHHKLQVDDLHWLHGSKSNVKAPYLANMCFKVTIYCKQLFIKLPELKCALHLFDSVCFSALRYSLLKIALCEVTKDTNDALKLVTTPHSQVFVETTPWLPCFCLLHGRHKQIELSHLQWQWSLFIFKCSSASLYVYVTPRPQSTSRSPCHLYCILPFHYFKRMTCILCIIMYYYTVL